MFCDETKLKLIAGKGGDGVVSYRREKYIARGGPDGGNGGNGGNIIFEVDDNINTLQELHRIKTFKAEEGKPGAKQQMNGHAGEDLVLKVPPGTIVFDAEKENVLADLTDLGEKFIIAKGGKGGYGNAHFKTSVRQTPDFAELGERGEEMEVVLELKLIADIGIVGLPSAGKSTFISRISNAKPKIAAYHFTTLTPNLGIVNVSQFIKKDPGSFVVADIPGLIEGASEGKGLGIQFLKHIQRTRILLHLIDVTSEDLYKDYLTVLKELESFSEDLSKKPQIIALNKIDLVQKEELDKKMKEFQKNLTNKTVYRISAATGDGLKDLILDLYKDLKSVCKNEKVEEKEEEKDYKVFKPLDEDEKRFEVRFKGYKVRTVDNEKIKYKRFKVTGKRIEQIVNMTDFENQSAVSRVYDVLEKTGVYKELQKLGATNGDIISISDKKLKYIEL